MNYFFADFQKLFETLAPVIIFLITLVVGLSLRRFLFGRLARWAQGTKTEVDDIIIVSTKGPFLIWCLMLGIYFALETSPLRDDLVHIAGKILLVLGIISVTMVVSSILSKFVKLYSGKIESALPVTSLTQHIARIVVFGVGIMVVLNGSPGPAGYAIQSFCRFSYHRCPPDKDRRLHKAGFRGRGLCRGYHLADY
jgi:hypothetical protein